MKYDMIMRKTSLYSTLFALLALLAMTSCSDFFEPETDDMLKGDKYISSNTEMYTGFVGILTKMQEIGDKEILLTDTRAELLEPTPNANPELIALYNYDNLEGNSYANPSPYYELVIACNDYIEKVTKYMSQPQVAQDENALGICKDMLSSAIRIKVWTYKTIGEIYGEAAWFDDAVTKVSVLDDPNNYKVVKMPELVDLCIDLMDKGVAGVPANRVIDWIAWLDPSNVTSIASSDFRKWQYCVPPFEAIYAELCLWKGAVLDAASQDANAWYAKAASTVFKGLNYYVLCEYNGGSDPNSTVYWLPSTATPGAYPKLWLQADPSYQECVSVILYDYTRNQTNSLVRHFCSDYPAQYLLRPATAAVERYINPAYNPGSSTGDGRYKYLVGKQNGDEYYMAKYRNNGGRNGVRSNAYEDDVNIYTYRATQYHIMLAEALNHLHRFNAFNSILNAGINDFVSNIKDATEERQLDADGNPIFTDAEHEANIREWEGFHRNWTKEAAWGTRKYPCEGLRGCYGLGKRAVELTPSGTVQIAAAVKTNDLAILDEYLAEFSCEGKVYPALNRMALRYNDLSIVSSRILPKYEGTGLEDKVRSAIEAGGNYVKYDLKLK